MFEDVNSLPADDPLRNPAAAVSPQAIAEDKAAVSATKTADKDQSTGSNGVMDLLPAKVLSAFKASGGTSSSIRIRRLGRRLMLTPAPPAQPKSGNGGVVVDASKRVAVPAFEGAGLRGVIETC